jgi:hypothetical protein
MDQLYQLWIRDFRQLARHIQVNTSRKPTQEKRRKKIINRMMLNGNFRAENEYSAENAEGGLFRFMQEPG